MILVDIYIEIYIYIETAKLLKYKKFVRDFGLFVCLFIK